MSEKPKARFRGSFRGRARIEEEWTATETASRKNVTVLVDPTKRADPEHTVTGFLSRLAALSLSFPSVTCAVVSSGCHRRLDDFHQNSMSSYITFNVTFTISATIYTMANFDIWLSSSNVETLPLRSYPLNYRNRASFWLLMSTIMAV